MVITKRQLVRIIKEEVEAAMLDEAFLTPDELTPNNIKEELNELSALLDNPDAKPRMLMKMMSLKALFDRKIKASKEESSRR